MLVVIRRSREYNAQPQGTWDICSHAFGMLSGKSVCFQKRRVG